MLIPTPSRTRAARRRERRPGGQKHPGQGRPQDFLTSPAPAASGSPGPGHRQSGPPMRRAGSLAHPSLEKALWNSQRDLFTARELRLIPARTRSATCSGPAASVWITGFLPRGRTAAGHSMGDIRAGRRPPAGGGTRRAGASDQLKGGRGRAAPSQPQPRPAPGRRHQRARLRHLTRVSRIARTVRGLAPQGVWRAPLSRAGMAAGPLDEREPTERRTRGGVSEVLFGQAYTCARFQL
jgi:hypothetical protein